LAVPGEETVDEVDQSRRDLASEADTLAEQVAANQSEREDVAQKLQALELQESVPTEEELAAVRATRDRGVRLAVDALVGEEPDASAVEGFVGQVTEGKDLATALEPGVRQADEVSDRLRREASRVADKSQLVARLQALDAKAEQLKTKQAGLGQRQSDWGGGWKRRWEASGVTPMSPPEMRGWLRQLAELVGLSTSLATASQQREGDASSVEAAAADHRA